MEMLIDPWNWWVEPFVGNVFMRRALLAGTLAVLATSVVGTWIVLRGLTFLVDALANGVLPGVALAVIFGFDPSLGALFAGLFMVAGVHVVRQNTPLPEDVSIGLLFVGMLALAVVIVSAGASTNNVDLHRLLFGSVTGLGMADIWIQGGAALVAVGGAILGHRAFLAFTFDETHAALLGFNPRLIHMFLMGLVTVSVVASFEAVGSLLVFAFFVAPPATALLLVRRIPIVMLVAVVLGSFAVVLGALISYHYDTAAGASMALITVILYLLVTAGVALWNGDKIVGSFRD